MNITFHRRLATIDSGWLNFQGIFNHIDLSVLLILQGLMFNIMLMLMQTRKLHYRLDSELQEKCAHSPEH